MRFIGKGAEPRALIDWKLVNKKSPENLHYRGGGFPLDGVKQALLDEQGYLCGYTMKPIRTVHDCHIEHIIPQSRGTSGVEDIDYQNMLACFPPSNSSVECEYGARRKGDYDVLSGRFLSPLNPAVRHAFVFNDDGAVEGANDDANASIQVLNLNCAVLQNDRAATIRGFLLRRNRKNLSAAEARRLAVEVLRPDANGWLTPFCEAIAQAATRYADREERRSQRMRGVRA